MSDDGGLRRARNLLTRPGVWIDEGGAGGYAVRRSPDRRGRIVMRLDEAAFRALIETPGLRPHPGGGWVARPIREEPADRAARPGMIEGVRTVVLPDGRTVERRANLGQCPLAWLSRRSDSRGRPYLDAAERAAGERLRHDAEQALRGSSVTMRWDALPRASAGSATRAEPGAASLSASRRVATALAAVTPEARPLVERVYLAHSGLQLAEADLGLRRRQGHLLLKRGLADLARHYRIG